MAEQVKPAANAGARVGVAAAGALLELRGIGLGLGAKEVLCALDPAGARGHVGCMEIARDQAVVSAVPKAEVSHPQAKVTHEAAIGSVDSKQLETLMTHELDPESAIDPIIRGMLT